MEKGNDENASTTRILYLRSVLDAFGTGLVSPFLSYFAVDLNATDSDLGWLSAVTNLMPNLMQIAWGALSDRAGKRVPFILVGGLWNALFWLLIFRSGSPTVLIVWVAVQALVGSMVLPAWSAIQGDMISPHSRGRLTSSIAFWAAVGSIIATLITSIYFIFIPQQTSTAAYLIPFIAAAIIGVIASLTILTIRKREHLQPVPTSQLLPGQLLQSLKQLPDFQRFLVASCIYGFFMAVAWPLFIVTQVNLLGMSTFEVGLLTVVNGLAVVLFQRWAGTLLDRAGRRPVMLVHRFGLVLVPLTYAIVPLLTGFLAIVSLFAINALTGFLLAIGNLAVLVYLLDVVPETYRGSLMALYNAVMGIVYFFGSLLGGYLSDFFTTTLGVAVALSVVYLISTAGRAAGAAAFLQVRETQIHDSSMKEEVMKHLRRGSR